MFLSRITVKRNPLPTTREEEVKEKKDKSIFLFDSFPLFVQVCRILEYYLHVNSNQISNPESQRQPPFSPLASLGKSHPELRATLLAYEAASNRIMLIERLAQ